MGGQRRLQRHDDADRRVGAGADHAPHHRPVRCLRRWPDRRPVFQPRGCRSHRRHLRPARGKQWSILLHRRSRRRSHRRRHARRSGRCPCSAGQQDTAPQRRQHRLRDGGRCRHRERLRHHRHACRKSDHKAQLRQHRVDLRHGRDRRRRRRRLRHRADRPVGERHYLLRQHHRRVQHLDIRPRHGHRRHLGGQRWRRHHQDQERRHDHAVGASGAAKGIDDGPVARHQRQQLRHACWRALDGKVAGRRHSMDGLHIPVRDGHTGRRPLEPRQQ